MINDDDMPPFKAAVGDTVFWTDHGHNKARAATGQVVTVGRVWVTVRRDDGCTARYRAVDGRPENTAGYAEEIRSAEQQDYLRRHRDMEARIRSAANLLGINIVAVRNGPSRTPTIPFERAEALAESLEALVTRLGLETTLASPTLPETP
jgi:hypothetical protein